MRGGQHPTAWVAARSTPERVVSKSRDEKKAGLAWQALVAPPADHRGSGMRPSAVVY